MLTLTPQNLAAMYDYLCLTKPFCDWGLPESDEVKFIVVKTRKYFGYYNLIDGKHHIHISQNSVGYTNSLSAIMSHEMIHLHLRESGLEMNGPMTSHNGAFRVCAAQVCKVHGFDLRGFY